MRRTTWIQVPSAAAALAMLASCSGGSSVAPNRASPQDGAHLPSGRVQGAFSPFGLLNINGDGHQLKSFYACPATGSLKYVSDYHNNVIEVYAGEFAGQAPCGQITSGISNPEGLFVKTATHDLYVANDSAHDIVVFHRGQLAAYNTYTDPTGQLTIDVTVANDGTVIASNVVQVNGGELGSISTWRGGPNGGTFVGNFAMTNDINGAFITVTKNGTVYFDDVYDPSKDYGAVWSLSCPAGACDAQTQVAGLSLMFPGGLASDATGDLLVNDSNAATADTFELPNPMPRTFRLAGKPLGMAINERDHHWFVADINNQDAAEYLYPSGKLVGTVPCCAGGLAFGIAVDP